MTRAGKRIPFIRQMTAADCGVASLAMVLAYHGRRLTLDEIRRTVGPGRHGATAASLLVAGGAYGLQGRSVTLDLDELHALPTGAILHWEFRHFVVFQRLRRGAVEIVDPAGGYRSVPIEAFRKAFTGVAILFETTEAFTTGDTRKRGRLRIFLKQILEYRGTILLVVGISFAVQSLSAALPLLTGVVIDRVVPRNDYSLLLLLAIGYTGLQVFGALLAFIREHLSLYLRTRLEAGFTLRFLDHLTHLPYAFFQQRTSGDLMMRLGSNSAVREILTSTLFSTMLEGLMASIYLALLVGFSPHLTLIVIGLATARLVVLAVMRRKQRRLLDLSLENQARSQTAQVEMLNGMETLKAMGLEHRAAESWSNIFLDGLNVSMERGRLDAAFNGILNLLATASTLVLMFYGTYLVLEGSWTLGRMMAFNALALGFLGPLNNLMQSMLRLQMLEVYLERLNDVWDTPREQADGEVVLAERLTGAVELENVSFRYSDQDPWVLQNVSLRIAAGSRVAIVGRTGSGKSSLARLIAGLYEPNAGRVLVDGKDAKLLDRRSVRRQMGTVTQDTQLFGGSIRRNIAFADPDLGLDRVVAAARLACLHDEIVAMPGKYETPLLDRGLSLSGGQRQRLAIARALAGDPKVLILDEATSHLDAVTEEQLSANLASLRCTSIVIAHRLSTVRDADVIVVLDAGRVVECGDHEDLIQLGGKYAELVHTQRITPRDLTGPWALEAL